MSETSEFDAFYGRTRRRVLLQSLVLTADVREATAATVSAYEQAWRRWGRIGGPEQQERWVRGQAYAARRRSGAPRGTSEAAATADRAGSSDATPTPDAEQAALLGTIAGLTPEQRAAWAAVEIAGLDTEVAAVELDLPGETVERELAAARSSLTYPVDDGEVPWSSHDVVVVLDDLAQQVSLPTPPRLRSGSGRGDRRPSRLVLPIAAATGVVVVASGWAVVSASGGPDDMPSTPSASAPASSQTVSPRVLLGADALGDLGPGGWEESATTADPTDAGPGSLCQRAPSADPAALGVQSRRFTAGSAAAEQTVVVSRSAELAAATYERTVGWWAGCANVTALLQGSYEVPGLGDDALVLTMRDWAEPTASYVVGLARAGSATVSLVSLDPVASAVEPVAADQQQPGTPEQAAAVLAEAVATACETEAAGCDTGGVPATPTVQRTAPPSPPGSRGLLTTVDLPPAGDLAEPWSASPPISPDGELRPTEDADATTPCDTADLATAGAGGLVSRTFGVPGDPDLPTYFGLVQTVATFATPDLADQYVQDTVDGFGTCAQRLDSAVVANLGQDLTDGPGGRLDGVVESAVWGLAYDNEQNERIFVRTAVVRNDTSVSRVTLVPAPGNDMTPEQFGIVATRASTRLADAAADQLPS